MLGHKFSDRKDIETCKKPKSKEKIKLKFAIEQRQAKVKFPAANADIGWLE